MDRTRDLLERAASTYEPTLGDIESSLADVRRRAAGNAAVAASDQPWESAKKTSRRRKGVVVLLLAATLSGGVAIAGNMLQGKEYAHSLGLSPHPLTPTGTVKMTVDGLAINGAVLTECPSDEEAEANGKSVELVSVGDTLYCVVADTNLDAWLIARRIQRDPVSDTEAANLASGGRGSLPSGKEIGEAFGFWEARSPTAYEKLGCRNFAEFDNPRGFCMDSYTGNDKAESLLGRAINGRALSLEEIDMVEMMLRINELEQAGEPSAELASLRQALAERIDPWWESHFGKTADDNLPAYGPCCGDLPV